MNFNKYLALLILLSPWASAVSGDMALPKGTRTVLLDNERVQMVRLVYPVGSESGMHSHAYAQRTAYFEKGGVIELRSEQGEPKRMTVADGQVFYLPAATHNLVNIGTTEVVIIEQELK